MHCNHSVPHFIEGDATNLSKVIRNTLDNAVKFTPNGIIHVDVTTLVKNKKIFLVIKVKDSGLGIADDIKPKIFERFFRGEQPLDHRFPGAGIGLTVVQKKVLINSVAAFHLLAKKALALNLLPLYPLRLYKIPKHPKLALAMRASLSLMI